MLQYRGTMFANINEETVAGGSNFLPINSTRFPYTARSYSNKFKPHTSPVRFQFEPKTLAPNRGTVSALQLDPTGQFDFIRFPCCTLKSKEFVAVE